MSEKPVAAFVLSLISGILVLLTSLFILVSVELLSLGGEGLGIVFLEVIEALIRVLGILGLIFGVLIIVGAVMIYSGTPQKVKIGSILVLVFSIISLFTVGGGFFIGFILGLIGGILGLTWKPPIKQESTTSDLPQV